jgi:hypothetical protein
VIMVDRVIIRSALDGANQLVDRILAEWDYLVHRFVAQVASNRLTDEGSHTGAATPRPVAELLVGAAGQPQVGGRILGHGDITVSRYRGRVNGAAQAMASPTTVLLNWKL